MYFGQISCGNDFCISQALPLKKSILKYINKKNKKKPLRVGPNFRVLIILAPFVPYKNLSQKL